MNPSFAINIRVPPDETDDRRVILRPRGNFRNATPREMYAPETIRRVWTINTKDRFIFSI